MVIHVFNKKISENITYYYFNFNVLFILDVCPLKSYAIVVLTKQSYYFNAIENHQWGLLSPKQITNYICTVI